METLTLCLSSSKRDQGQEVQEAARLGLESAHRLVYMISQQQEHQYLSEDSRLTANEVISKFKKVVGLLSRKGHGIVKRGPMKPNGLPSESLEDRFVGNLHCRSDSINAAHDSGSSGNKMASMRNIGLENGFVQSMNDQFDSINPPHDSVSLDNRGITPNVGLDDELSRGINGRFGLVNAPHSLVTLDNKVFTRTAGLNDGFTRVVCGRFDSTNAPHDSASSDNKRVFIPNVGLEDGLTGGINGRFDSTNAPHDSVSLDNKRVFTRKVGLADGLTRGINGQLDMTNALNGSVSADQMVYKPNIDQSMLTPLSGGGMDALIKYHTQLLRHQLMLSQQPTIYPSQTPGDVVMPPYFAMENSVACSPLSSARSFLSSLSMDGSISTDHQLLHQSCSQLRERKVTPSKSKCFGKGDENGGKCSMSGRCRCSKRK